MLVQVPRLGACEVSRWLEKAEPGQQCGQDEQGHGQPPAADSHRFATSQEKPGQEKSLWFI